MINFMEKKIYIYIYLEKKIYIKIIEKKNINIKKYIYNQIKI